MNIVLIGFRGSGKSAAGRELARRLSMQFIDTDDEVERRAGKTIAEIFETEGEARFRELEREEVLKACLRDRCVIAAGGGAVENPELAAAMKEAGLVILLSAPAEVLYERTARDEKTASRRPALTENAGLAEVKELLGRRRAAYCDTAHLEIDTAGLKPSEVAEAIVAKLRSGELPKKFSQIIT
jgi:shikimate kinase